MGRDDWGGGEVGGGGGGGGGGSMQAEPEEAVQQFAQLLVRLNRISVFHRLSVRGSSGTRAFVDDEE